MKAIPNENGIIIHYVTEDKDKIPEYANIHTHGMENHNLPNLCLAAGYSFEDAADILNTLTDCIIEEEEFNFGGVHCIDELDEDGNYQVFLRVMFRKVICCEEDAYLVILLDENGYINDYQNYHPEKWEDIKLQEPFWVDINGYRAAKLES